jgi:catechol 2,3-dioxygenase-like lactoylglutathione lyase family enzyme
MERRDFIGNIGFAITGILAGSQAYGGSRNKSIKPTMEANTQVINKFMMLSINVSDMPKAKSFYVDKLGLKITTEYRIDNDNWWVSLTFPDGGATFTLARASQYPEKPKSGTLALYFETSDVDTAHKELIDKGIIVNDIQNDLFGPGSGVKFFNFEDPDGNLVHIVQVHKSRAPF